MKGRGDLLSKLDKVYLLSTDVQILTEMNIQYSYDKASEKLIEMLELIAKKHKI